ncbi:hypothetical protein EZV61_11585 [Corallincola luteus]|uniref:HupE/UreJ family protein n=1 Tax=Corallincola luteus TaxID=1775177 RepID=A0ABY2AJG0_9GAMM|nr:HupE/UreJ family protein [Corallincola luteus]TCI02925.1 hypothetical protein EZV61_11585 [Corallincola luteus]
MKSLITKYGAPAAVLLSAFSSAQVFAHAGHEHVAHGAGAEFSAGLMHTITGWDHLIAMVGFGLLIATFVGSQRVGALVMSGVALLSGLVAGSLVSGMLASASLFEQLVLASVFALPVLALVSWRQAKFQLLVLSAIVLFSACHGVVQGIEAQMVSAGLMFNLGLLVSSMLLLSLSAWAAVVLRSLSNAEADEQKQFTN